MTSPLEKFVKISLTVTFVGFALVSIAFLYFEEHPQTLKGWYPIDLITYHNGKLMYVDVAETGLSFSLLFLNDTPREQPMEMSFPTLDAVGFRFNKSAYVYFFGDGWLSTSWGNEIYTYRPDLQPFLFQFQFINNSTAFTMVAYSPFHEVFGVCDQTFGYNENMTNYLCDTRQNALSQVLTFYIKPRISQISSQ